MTTSRRRLLVGTAALLPFAGCIDGFEASGSGGGDGADDDRDDRSAGGNGDDDLELLDHAVRTFQRPEVPEEPSLEVLPDREEADEWLDGEDVPDRDRESIEGLLAEADFEESLAVVIEAEGPDLCHEIAVDSVELEDDEETTNPTLAIRAEVQSAAGDEGADACGQQVTGLVAVVLATFSGEPPTEVSVNLVAHDGSAKGFGVTWEDDTAEGRDPEFDDTEPHDENGESGG